MTRATRFGIGTFILMASTALADEAQWRQCQSDAQCIVIQGTCSKAAVNASYKDRAEKHYERMAAKANCVSPEHMPKVTGARCDAGQCVTIQ